MKKSKIENLDGIPDDDMPDEIDFSKGVRGKFADVFNNGRIAVVLDSDVAEVFPTSEAANEALRDMARIIKRSNTVARATAAKGKKRRDPKSASPNLK